MPPQTIDVAATFEVEQPGGALAPLKLTDLQHADPAAGPGALDASVLAVGASVEALRTQLATPIPVSLGSPVTLGGAVDVGDRAGRQLGHVQVDNFPAFPATQAVSAAALPLPTGAATAARQDTQAGKLDTLAAIDYATEGTLQSVSGKLGTPASDDMLSLLRSIAANTLLETTKADVLQLSADQVNLNTDQVEAKLDTVSARIGTTGVPGSAVERIEAVRAAIAGTPAVSVSNWPATQPVSLAANVTADIASFPAAMVTNSRLSVTATGAGAASDGVAATTGFIATTMVYNGAAWDRARDATTVQGSSTGLGVMAAGLVGFDQSVYRRVITDVNGFLRVTPSSSVSNFADGTNLAAATAIGNWGWNGGAWDRLRTATGSTGTLKVAQSPATAGGLSMFRLLSAASTNAAAVKASAGQLYGWAITNTSAAMKFVKLYNKASAPTVGTDSPVMTLALPAGQMVEASRDSGIAFSTGIAIAVTGAVADTDTTAIAANDVVVNLQYA